MSNLRATYEVRIVEVLEGDGTKEKPYTIVKYVLEDNHVAGYIHEMPYFEDSNV